MSGRLLERETETAALEGGVASAREGRGALVCIDGPPGIGKSALVDLAAELAGAEAMTVLTARAGLLERRYGFGVVRDLFGRVLAGAGAGAPGEQSLLRGAAGHAWAALEGEPAGAPDEGAVMYGLFWLVANVCERAPLAILVDDAHWADPHSLRFLAFLARRVEGLRLMLVIASRGGDPDAPRDLLESLAAAPDAIVLQPGGLSARAVASLVATAFGESPDPAFAGACHAATDGNPFLLHELIGALRRDGFRPTEDAAVRVAHLGLPAVAHSVLMRIGRLEPSAMSLARAMAVLGEDTDPRTAFALAQLTADEGMRAVDALIGVDVVRDRRPLAFSHALVRDAVYRDVPALARASLHARAADLLMKSGADPERIAAHLLEAMPARSGRHVEVLRTAAGVARSRGSAPAAAAYLRRALEEQPSGPLQAAVLRELATVEAVLRSPSAAERLEAALAGSPDPRERALITMDLASVLMYGGSSQRAEAVLETAIDALGPEDEELILRLQTMWGNASLDANRDGAGAQRLAQLRRSAERDTPAALPLRIYLGFRGAMRAEPADGVVDLLRRGWNEGRILQAASGHSPSLDFIMLAATWSEAYDWAVEVADAVLASARETGSVLAYCSGSAHRSIASLQRGDVQPAEADARAALDLATEHQLEFTLPYFASYLADALAIRGATSEAEEVIAEAVRRSTPGTIGAAVALTSRGWLRLDHGRRTEAAADLREAQRFWDARGVVNPGVRRSRGGLALAIAPEHPQDAQTLLATDLELARRAGLPATTAQILRAIGLISDGDRQLASLRRARETARGSAAPLTLAQAELDLGAALRRAGHRRDAREPLRRSLDIAVDRGAGAIAERARDELRASGAHLRRERITGRDALTASERRIAELAARGHTNREIAEQLFLTPKTVENHLGRIYFKLGISSRRNLAEGLARG